MHTEILSVICSVSWLRQDLNFCLRLASDKETAKNNLVKSVKKEGRGYKADQGGVVSKGMWPIWTMPLSAGGCF